MTAETVTSGRLPRRRPAVHPQPRRAVQARDLAPRRPARHRRHGDRAGSPPSAWPPQHRAAPGSPCSSSPSLVGARDRAVAGPGRRDDRHARADRAAAQLRRPGRRARRLERLPRSSARPRPDRPPTCSASTTARSSIGVFIGAVTFTGSIVAFLKLSARITSAPLMLPGKNALNLGALVAFVALTVVVRRLAVAAGCSPSSPSSRWRSAGTWSPRSAAATCPSSCRCSTATPAGRPPRPASCSTTTCSSSPARWSAPRVPTSPTSCARAMNRSFISVIAGGFGDRGPERRRRPTTASTARSSAVEVAELLREAASVVITPGYGMAVAQAQYPVADLTRQAARARRRRPLRHPPRRRPPSRSHERAARRGQGPLRHRPRDGRDQRRLRRHLRRARHRRQRHRQPGRRRGPHLSPIAGMPVLRVWEAEGRRRLQALDGHAATPACRTRCSSATTPQMLFGDAKERVEDILRAL